MIICTNCITASSVQWNRYVISIHVVTRPNFVLKHHSCKVVMMQLIIPFFFVCDWIALGVVTLRSDYTVCEKDQVLKPEQAQILVKRSYIVWWSHRLAFGGGPGLLPCVVHLFDIEPSQCPVLGPLSESKYSHLEFLYLIQAFTYKSVPRCFDVKYQLHVICLYFVGFIEIVWSHDGWFPRDHW